MRVALVTDWYAPRRGGIETQLAGLAKALTDAGIQTTVVTSFPGPAPDDGVRTDRLAVRLLPVAKLALPFGLVRALSARLTPERFDLVHAHPSIVAPFCFAAAIAARNNGLPCLHTFHSAMTRLPTLLRRANALVGMSDPSVALSAVSRSVARQAEGISPGKPVHVLPNGINARFWAQTAKDQSPGMSEPLRLVAAMRLERTKRPQALLAVLARAVHRLGPKGRRVELTIAGDGSLAARLRRSCERLGLADRVTFAGWLPPEGLRALYQRSHVFVAASNVEAFGIAALEARAVGLPVIAHHGTGIADFIDADRTGWLVHSDDEMAALVARIAEEPETIARLAEAEFDDSVYDWANVAAAHETIYASLIGKVA